MSHTAICTTCGQTINEVILINGLPYGTTCAERKLGIKEFPSWFKGGDWDKAKSDKEKRDADWREISKKSEDILNDCWKEWIVLSRAHYNSRLKMNQWAQDFIESLYKQLGYPHTQSFTDYDNWQDAKANWNSGFHGSLPFFYNTPKKISSLSPKQQSILEKFIQY